MGRTIDFSQIVNHTPEAIVVIGSNMEIVYGNQQCLSLFGCTYPQLMNSDISDWIVLKDLDRAIQGKEPTSQICKLQTKTGEKKPVEVNYAPLKGESAGMMCLYLREHQMDAQLKIMKQV